VSLAEDDAEPQSSPSTTLDVALDTVSDDLDRDACPVADRVSDVHGSARSRKPAEAEPQKAEPA
jgi:hypothetical protein